MKNKGLILLVTFVFLLGIWTGYNYHEAELEKTKEDKKIEQWLNGTSYLKNLSRSSNYSVDLVCSDIRFNAGINR